MTPRHQGAPRRLSAHLRITHGQGLSNTTLKRMGGRAFRTGVMLLWPLTCDEQMRAEEGGKGMTMINLNKADLSVDNVHTLFGPTKHPPAGFLT